MAIQLPLKQSYFHSLDSFNLDGLGATAGGAGTAAAMLRQRSLLGAVAGQSYQRQGSTAASRLSAVCSPPPAAASEAGPAETMVVREGGLQAPPGADLISALAALEAVAAVAAAAAEPDERQADAQPLPADGAPAAAGAAQPAARPPRRTTFSAWEHMQAAAGPASKAAPASQPPAHLPPVELPRLAPVPAKARRESSTLDSPASMTAAQFGSLSSVKTTEAAVTGGGSSRGTEEAEAGPEEAGREAATPDACQAAVAALGAAAPPAIALLCGADLAASSSRDLVRRAPALMSQVQHLLELPTQALPAVAGGAAAGCGGLGAEEQAPGQRRRASWRDAAQVCSEEMACTLRRTQQLAAALPPPAFRK